MNVLVACEESQEVWKQIHDFPYYEVSSMGRVRSKLREIRYLGGRTRIYPSKTLRQGNSNGYPFVNLCKNNSKSKSVKIHVLVANAFLGARPNGYDVCHVNGNRYDNRVKNLEYGTRSKNNLDNYRVYGYVNAKQKLNPGIAKEIRERIANGESQNSIAKLFNVCKSTIGAIKSEKLYRVSKEVGL